MAMHSTISSNFTMNCLMKLIYVSMTVCLILIIVPGLQVSSASNVGGRLRREADCGGDVERVKPRDKIRTADEQQKIKDCYKKRTAQKKLITKFYLVPRYNKECEDVGKGVMRIKDFQIYKAGTNLRYLEFPGCFDISSILNVDGNSEIVKSWKIGEAPNIFANLQWQMTNGKGEKVGVGFNEEFDCQNQDAIGCGGYGNGCNYCDFCHQIQNRERKLSDDPITCPTGPGIQTLKRKNMCVDNWDRIDKDGAFGFPDGEPDFFCYPENEPYVELAESLSDGAFGTMQLQITLAANNTQLYDLTKKYASECGFRDWHKRRLESWRTTKTVGCNMVVFDICKYKPQLIEGELYCGRKVST